MPPFVDKTEQLAKFERSATNHTPSNADILLIEEIRQSAKSLAYVIINYSNFSREQSLALTHLEEVVMWAVKGVVLNG